MMEKPAMEMSFAWRENASFNPASVHRIQSVREKVFARGMGPAREASVFLMGLSSASLQDHVSSVVAMRPQENVFWRILLMEFLEMMVKPVRVKICVQVGRVWELPWCVMMGMPAQKTSVMRMEPVLSLPFQPYPAHWEPV